MNWNPTNNLAERFAWLIDGLCNAIGTDAHKRGMEAALAWAIWIRVRLLGDRLIRLAERARAGRLRVVRRGGAERPVAGPRAPRLQQGRCKAVASLPHDFGWVKRLLPETAHYAGVLRYMLRDPDVAALVEQAPQARHVLRPLCHLLGVPLPELLRPRHAVAGAPASTAERVAAAPPPVADEPPLPPPVPAEAAKPAAVPHHLRPGGLYWDGRRLQWS